MLVSGVPPAATSRSPSRSPAVAAVSAEELAERIVTAFDRLVPSLYEPEDVERQSVEIIGRDGVLRLWPLLTVSLGIATTALRGYASPVARIASSPRMKP